MAKIREDLEGVVYLSGDGADVLTLKAGDEVPEGYAVGDHLLDEPEAPKPARATRKPAPTQD